jgi:hypothetical protein
MSRMSVVVVLGAAGVVAMLGSDPSTAGAHATIRCTTWNLQWFPNGAAKDASLEEQDHRIADAATVLKPLHLDILLLQEVRDYTACDRLGNAIEPGAYHVENRITHGNREIETAKNIRKREVAIDQLMAHIRDMVGAKIPTINRLIIGANFLLREPGPFYWTVSKDLQNKGMTGEPVLVPPTWNKADSHRALEKVWSLAAHELSGAENIFVIGYSMPETDSFFRHLYALGTVGGIMLRRFWVFNPNHSVERRFHDLLGPGAEDRFEFNPGGHNTFSDAINYLLSVFPPDN